MSTHKQFQSFDYESVRFVDRAPKFSYPYHGGGLAISVTMTPYTDSPLLRLRRIELERRWIALTNRRIRAIGHPSPTPLCLREGITLQDVEFSVLTTVSRELF